MYFLQYFSIPIDKPTVEDYLYRKFSTVYAFYTNLTDDEDARMFIDNMTKSPEEFERETLEEHKFWADIGEYKATGFIEELNLHDFETCRKNTIIPNFTKWCESIGVSDFPIVRFDKKTFDKFTRFMIEQPRNRTKKGKGEYYSVKTIDNMIKEVHIYLKALRDIGYTIDESALDFKLIKGNRKNAHIRYINNEKDNVFSITAAELEKVRNAVNDDKLDEKLRRAATLFTLQTLLGGLRISELNLITKDSFKKINERYYCFITTKKTKKMIDSPLHSELLPILERLDFNIVNLRFKTDIDYNSALRELAKTLGLNREIVQLDSRANAEIQEVKTEKLYNLFTSRLARKAAITLLFTSGRYSLEQISKMTKHSLTAIQYYVAVLTDEKAAMMGSL